MIRPESVSQAVVYRTVLAFDCVGEGEGFLASSNWTPPFRGRLLVIGGITVGIAM